MNRLILDVRRHSFDDVLTEARRLPDQQGKGGQFKSRSLCKKNAGRRLGNELTDRRIADEERDAAAANAKRCAEVVCVIAVFSGFNDHGVRGGFRVVAVEAGHQQQGRKINGEEYLKASFQSYANV